MGWSSLAHVELQASCEVGQEVAMIYQVARVDEGRERSEVGFCSFAPSLAPLELLCSLGTPLFSASVANLGMSVAFADGSVDPERTCLPRSTHPSFLEELTPALTVSRLAAKWLR